jgi:hypothetical protein
VNANSAGVRAGGAGRGRFVGWEQGWAYKEWESGARCHVQPSSPTAAPSLHRPPPPPVAGWENQCPIGGSWFG